MMFGTNTGSNETWKRIPKNSIGVELGVWKGESSAKFLNRASHLHLVDPWSSIAYEDSDEFGDYQGYLNRYSKIVGSNKPEDFQKYYDSIAKSVQAKFKNSPVTIHRMNTDKFFETFKGQVDWVYVDALHSYNGCLSDLRNSLKLVNTGGYIFGDDYSDNKPGVKAAVDMFIKETKLEIEIFSGDQYQVAVL